MLVTFKIQLGYKFIYSQKEDMPLCNFTRKNIGVTDHIIAPWSLLGPQKGGLNDKYGHGAKM